MRVRGYKETLAALKNFGRDGENLIKDITVSGGHEIAEKAKENFRNVADGLDPTGTIMRSINFKPENNGFKAVISVNQLPMGAYIEFGTGVFVEVDPEWKDIAWQFYVNGMGQLHAHPYFYPAFDEGREKYMRDLKDALEHLTRRYNSRR
ncbi:hypothetical protein [Chryseobacterium indologenes]|uniref:HK97 gp10 family phage protein n=1 Tax=Chryseobacterium indologenes TaxID=253 RepID=A0A0N0IUP0_CHRID|nr:hypothetical protein [Chryseobacterium indologenes]KPE49764.1 hypothetical protein AOB46_18750 [Chryseobacterium indologenes]